MKISSRNLIDIVKKATKWRRCLYTDNFIGNYKESTITVRHRTVGAYIEVKNPTLSRKSVSQWVWGREVIRYLDEQDKANNERTKSLYEEIIQSDREEKQRLIDFINGK